MTETGQLRVMQGVVAVYRPDPVRHPWRCYNTYDGSFIECRTDADVAGYRELPRFLSEAAAQPPALITAEDVGTAFVAWRERLEQPPWIDNYEHLQAAFVADYLNRRGEQ